MSAGAGERPGAVAWSAVAWSAVADIVSVVVFVLVGTASHESGGVAHVAAVATPFLLALAAGWSGARAWRAPTRVWPTGAAVWFATVAGGLVLRPLFGGGLAVSFAVVTALFLAATLLGWRLLATLARRRRPASA